MTDPVGLPSLGSFVRHDPSFVDLLRREHPDSLARLTQPLSAEAAAQVPHGTTVLGLKYADGIVMAGDRRATAGYTIADDKMRKVFAADDYSAIAIAGAAGMAVDMVKLFQLELEHYEKLTGDRLSLEGKANRLAQMIRSNFPLAMQGLVVVPLFGGYDERRAEGRLFYYDATGGRWEEDDYQATGSGSQPAKNSLKKRWRPGLDREAALRAAVEALLDASEDDVATGGPNPVRHIYPIVLTVTASGADEMAEVRGRRRGRPGPRGASLMSFMPYVAPEQMMKDRSEYAHKGIARGRSVIGLEIADGLLFIAENPSATLHKISEIYDKIAFAGVGKYSEFEDLRIAGCAMRTCAATPTGARTSRPATSRTPTPRPCPRSSPSR